MRAYSLQGISDLQLGEIPTPHIKENEVLVRVHAAGICGSDIPRVFKNGTYHFPTIPGHEFAGEVFKCGAAVDKSWLGKRVGVFPLIPCKNCGPCRKEKYEMCRNYSYLGSRCDGGFAEYVAVPVWNLIELPDNVSYEQAAMLEPMAVAIHAIRSIGVKTEDTVAIQGMGTIGCFVAMFLIQMGIRKLFVIGNKDFQKSTCLSAGIPENHFIDIRICRAEDRILELTGGEGVDVFFECVGKNETVLTAINSVKPSGRIQLVGNPSGDMQIEKNVYWKILRNQLTVKGSWNSTFTGKEVDDWHYVIKLLETRNISPEKYITHKLSFDRLMDGLEIMRDKAEDYIKIMILLGD